MGSTIMLSKTQAIVMKDISSLKQAIFVGGILPQIIMLKILEDELETNAKTPALTLRRYRECIQKTFTVGMS